MTTMRSEMRAERAERREASLFWPIVLIGAGIIVLMELQGMLVNSPLMLLANCWPVLLIVAGVELLLPPNRALRMVVTALMGVLVVAGALWLLTTPAVVMQWPAFYNAN